MGASSPRTQPRRVQHHRLKTTHHIRKEPLQHFHPSTVENEETCPLAKKTMNKMPIIPKKATTRSLKAKALPWLAPYPLPDKYKFTHPSTVENEEILTLAKKTMHKIPIIPPTTPTRSLKAKAAPWLTPSPAGQVQVYPSIHLRSARCTPSPNKLITLLPTPVFIAGVRGGSLPGGGVGGEQSPHSTP